MNIIITKQQILHSEEFVPDSIPNAHTVYEVLRVIDGVVLFPDDHFARLQQSLTTRR